jgi:hypothetical protein
MCGKNIKTILVYKVFLDKLTAISCKKAIFTGELRREGVRA